MSTDSRHGFEDDQIVTFQDVKGMTEVNNQPFKIKVTSPFTFTIGDTSKYGSYLGGGTVTEVKTTETVNFVCDCFLFASSIFELDRAYF